MKMDKMDGWIDVGRAWIIVERRWRSVQKKVVRNFKLRTTFFYAADNRSLNNFGCLAKRKHLFLYHQFLRNNLLLILHHADEV